MTEEELRIVSCSTTLASIILAVIAVLLSTPTLMKSETFTRGILFLKGVFTLSISCSLLALFGYYIKRFNSVAGEVFLHLSIIVFAISILLIVPVIFILV